MVANCWNLSFNLLLDQRFIFSYFQINRSNQRQLLPTFNAIYALAVIFLTYLICIAQKVFNMNHWLKSIHFLAFYAYRAFLVNIFGDRIFWQYFNFKQLALQNIYLAVLLLWICTWCASYLSVYVIHQLWLKINDSVDPS